MAKKRKRATDIDWKTRHEVIERDQCRCVLCGRWCGDGTARNIAHYIGRGNGGLGIKENLALLCTPCHIETDNSPKSKENKERIRIYLEEQYPGFPDEKRIYRKEYQ